MMIEKVFLGCLMKENYLIKDTIIVPDQLEDSRHRTLFQKMIEFYQAGKPVNFITLTTLPNLENYGGESYIAELSSFAEIEKFEEVEHLIIDSWKEREKRTILTTAAHNNWEIHKVIEKLEEINEINIIDFMSITECLIELYEAPWKEDEKMGVSTGIGQLDKLTGGWQDGGVAILAASPSMGKTDVMLHFAKETGWGGYLPIIFSLEMSQRNILERLIASTGNFHRSRMRDPVKRLLAKQKEKWPSVIGKLSETNIQIFDQTGQTIPEMRAKIRKVVHEFPDKKPIIFIDSLTLIRSNELYGGNAHLQISEISRNLKAMAKDFTCPIICLAPLNQSDESRVNKRPMMSDIWEFGSVEQEADLIMFLYREKYNNHTIDENTLEIIISKNRNGPVGTVKVKYNEDTGKIEEDGNNDN